MKVVAVISAKDGNWAGMGDPDGLPL